MQAIAAIAGFFANQKAAQILHFIQEELALFSVPDEIRGFRIDVIKDTDFNKKLLLRLGNEIQKVLREIAAKFLPGSSKSSQQCLAIVAIG